MDRIDESTNFGIEANRAENERWEEENAGPAGRVTIEGLATQYPVISFGPAWNGWQSPRFDLKTAYQIIEDLRTADGDEEAAEALSLFRRIELKSGPAYGFDGLCWEKVEPVSVEQSERFNSRLEGVSFLFSEIARDLRRVDTFDPESLTRLSQIASDVSVAVATFEILRSEVDSAHA